MGIGIMLCFVTFFQTAVVVVYNLQSLNTGSNWTLQTTNR